jgi:hypothetical protein
MVKDQKRTYQLSYIVLLCSSYALMCLEGCSRSSSLPGVVVESRELIRQSSPDLQDDFEVFFPDFSYFAKARMTETEFSRICNRLGMKQMSTDMRPEEKSKISWRRRDLAPAWWDPSFDRTSTLWNEKNGVWLFAKYENGHLYLRAYSM